MASAIKNITSATTYQKKKVVSVFDSKSDAEIWEEFSRGSEAAFLYIYNRYFDALFRFAYQFSKDQDFIKDCIQDLFVELNKGFSKLVESSEMIFSMDMISK